jgi:hypothetical protein
MIDLGLLFSRDRRAAWHPPGTGYFRDSYSSEKRIPQTTFLSQAANKSKH